MLYGDAVALLAGNILDSSTAAAAVSGGGSEPNGATERVPALKFLDYSEVCMLLMA